MTDAQPPSDNDAPNGSQGAASSPDSSQEMAFSVPALLLGAWQSYLQTLPELIRHTGPLALLIAFMLAWLGDAGAGGSKLFWAWVLYIPLMLVSLRVLLGERGAEVYRLPSQVLWRFVLVNLGMGVLVSIGFALLVVPGVLLLALVLVYPVLLLEERQSPLDAVVNSMDYSKDALIPLALGVGVLYVTAEVLAAVANSLFEVQQLTGGLWLMVWQLLYWFASFYFLAVMVAVYHNRPALHCPADSEDDLPVA